MELYLIKITKPNGDERFYIGQTKLTSAIRFRQHCYGDQQLVDKKIKQYGTDNTELIVLADNIESAEELDHLEILYIKLFESFVGWGKGGYNKNLGGLGRRTVEIVKDELQSCIDQGLSTTEMCKRFGNISHPTLAAWMLTYEIELKSRKEQHENTIRLMVENGNTTGEIAKAIGISSSSVCTALKTFNLKATRKKSTKATADQVEQIIQLTQNGKSLFEIENLTGLNYNMIYKIQNKQGIKSKAKRGRGNGVTLELITKITELKATGLSLSAISRELNCAVSTISNILNGKYDHLK